MIYLYLGMSSTIVLCRARGQIVRVEGLLTLGALEG